MLLALEGRREPGLDDLLGELGLDDLRAADEHVPVVVAAPDLGAPDAVAEDRPDAGELVAGDRLARAAAAEHDGEVDVTDEHLPADGVAERGVVDRLLAAGGAVRDLVAGAPEVLAEVVFERDAVVVGRDCDPHRRM